MTMDLMWGQHPALGAPFIDDNCIIDLPAARVNCTSLSSNTRFVEGVYDWPLAPGKDGGIIDLRQVASAEADTFDSIFLSDLPEGWYAVTNTAQTVGFGMAWPLQVFPALWFWQAYGGAYVPPWYGRNYSIALEPFSTQQLNVVDSVADGSAHVLRPDESIEAQFVAVAYAGIKGVERIRQDGEVIPNREA